MDVNSLVKIAENVSLREGSEGVRNFFRVVYQNIGISTRECAIKMKIPIPIVAAIKQEAIKLELVKPGATLRLTEKGIGFCENVLHLALHQENVCTNCSGVKYIIPSEYEVVKNQLEDILQDRPEVDVTIDQAHGTVETALRRAVLATEKGLLFGKKIAFLGDDDYVSVAIMLLHQHLFKENKPQLVVFDIDERILAHIQEISNDYSFEIETVVYDARDELMAKYDGYFDAVFTDPPYTLQGARLFLSRASSLLKSELGLHVFFSFGHKSPSEILEVQKAILELGFCHDEVIPNFNTYLGAAILGNIGQMMVLVRADIDAANNLHVEDAIYTSESEGI